MTAHDVLYGFPVVTTHGKWFAVIVAHDDVFGFAVMVTRDGVYGFAVVVTHDDAYGLPGCSLEKPIYRKSC